MPEALCAQMKPKYREAFGIACGFTADVTLFDFPKPDLETVSPVSANPHASRGTVWIRRGERVGVGLMNDRWTGIASEVRRRVRRLIAVRGLAWVGAAGVGLLCLAGLSDWWFHWDATSHRLLLLVGILLAVGGVAWTMLLRPLRVSVSDVDVARAIEHHLSRPEGGLSSAAQFRISDCDPALGSVELQRSTITRADRLLVGFDVDGLFSTVSVRRAVIAAILIAVTASATIVAAPRSVWTAVSRILVPFSDISWPRTTHLQILTAELTPLEGEALRTTAGEPLTVYVENTLGSLPDDLTLEFMLVDEPLQQEPLRTTLLRDRNGRAHEVGIVTLLAYRGPMRFRVRGGDDEGTGWQSVAVVPAPTVAALTVTVIPPAYTGQAATSSERAGLIEGLVGSRVTIVGKANKPLTAAALHRERSAPLDLKMADGGLRFEGDFAIDESGTSWYWFELEDRHGLREPEPSRYELRGIADRPPVVYLDEPVSDLTVTSAAAVPLMIIVRDDLGLAELRLRYREHGSSPDEAAQTHPLPVPDDRSLEEGMPTTWELAPLALSEGARLTFWVEAVDKCDLNAKPGEPAGQVGTSAQRHLTVISESEKQRELALRQSSLLDALEALRDRQAHSRDVTAQLRIQAELTMRLRPADLDLLKQAELEQRDIRRQVAADEANGLMSEIDQIQRELGFNDIADPESANRLTLLADHMAELGDRWFPVIEQALARARKSTDRPLDGFDEGDGPLEADSRTSDGTETEDVSHLSARALRELQEAEDAQASALDVFAEAAALLGGWRQKYHLSSELDAMIANQTEVQEETRAVGRETVAKALSGLPAQQQADLARLSDRQRRLAMRLEELLEHTGEGPSDGTSSDPGAAPHATPPAEDLSEIRQWLKQQGTAAAMHQAAESLKRNEIPAAVSSQEEILTALREFGARLHETPLSDPATRLTELRETREQVETLRKQQEGLAQSSQQALAPSADPRRAEELQRLLKQQSELADQAEQIARHLQRQQHRDTAQSADRAALRMRDAQSALEQEQPQDVAVNQQEALDDLEQLANELAKREHDAEGQMAQQRMLELANTLRELAAQQQALCTATSELDTRFVEHGSWSRRLGKELLRLSEQQQALRKQLDAEQSTLSDLPVVRAALERTGEPMQRAGTLLDDRQTGQPTVAAQQEAERRLLAVVEIVSEDEGGQATASASPPPGGERGSPPPGSQRHLTMQLKLLRRMQADLNELTAAVAMGGQNGGTPPIVVESPESLVREQGRIAELTRTLMQPVIDMQGPADDAGAQHDDVGEKLEETP
jgi:hypothetical protein